MMKSSIAVGTLENQMSVSMEIQQMITISSCEGNAALGHQENSSILNPN